MDGRRADGGGGSADAAVALDRSTIAHDGCLEVAVCSNALEEATALEAFGNLSTKLAPLELRGPPRTGVALFSDTR